MAFSELEGKRCERAMSAFLEKRRPPAHIRPELDIGYRITDQSVEIFEVRPRWDRPQEKTETPVAKATYVKAQRVWRVFWMRRDLKWHRYDPAPEVALLEDFARLVDKDKHACFFG
jgi:hypothetical protein